MKKNLATFIPISLQSRKDGVNQSGDQWLTMRWCIVGEAEGEAKEADGSLSITLGGAIEGTEENQVTAGGDRSWIEKCWIKIQMVLERRVRTR